mmetsp:Transcript_25757/g.70814  ORF Transcript_25757/g.70814 Transcript_25757/m.70814 type:complete len:93 (-) Transcript_25757:770-1048(-)
MHLDHDTAQALLQKLEGAFDISGSHADQLEPLAYFELVEAWEQCLFDRAYLLPSSQEQHQERRLHHPSRLLQAYPALIVSSTLVSISSDEHL